MKNNVLLISNNINLVKINKEIDNKNNNIKEKEYNLKNNHKNYNTEIKHESNNYKNIDKKENHIEKKLIFDSKEKNGKVSITKKDDIKNRQEQIKEIYIKELKNIHEYNKIKSIKKNKINNMIYKQNIKDNKDNNIIDIPFTSERMTKTIFKMIKIRTDISQNRSNNLSSLNSRNESSKNNYKYKNIYNFNSYAKIAKNKNYISPFIKNKNKKYMNNYNSNETNEFDEIFNKYYENSYHNFSLNSFNINFNNTSINNSNKNNEKEKSNNKKKKTSNLLNKIEKTYTIDNKDKDEDEMNKTIDINDEEFNDDGIKYSNKQNITDVNQKDNNRNKKKKAKFAEIFLFDNNEEDLKDKNKEIKNDKYIDNVIYYNQLNKTELKNKDNNIDYSEV